MVRPSALHAEDQYANNPINASACRSLRAGEMERVVEMDNSQVGDNARSTRPPTPTLRLSPAAASLFTMTNLQGRHRNGTGTWHATAARVRHHWHHRLPRGPAARACAVRSVPISKYPTRRL